MAEKKVPIELEIKDDIQKETEKRKFDLIKTILKQDTTEDPTIALAKIHFVERLMKDFERKTSDEQSDMAIWNKLLLFMGFQQAFQQRQDNTAQMLMLMQQMQQMQPKSDEFAKMMQLYMQQYMQQQAQMQQLQMQMQQQLLTLLFGKQREEFKANLEELAKKTDEMIKQLNARIDFLMSQGAEKEPKLKQYVQELIETKEALEQLRDKLGLGEKETPVVDEKGKIQAGKLIERGIRLAEKIIEKMPMQAPQPKPVQQIPMQQATQPAPAPPAQTETKPETEELKRIEEKIEDLERKAEVTFNIPEQTAPQQEINIQETQTNIEEEQKIEYGGVGGNETEETPSEGAGEQELNAEVVETGNKEPKESGHSEGNKEQ